jgi:hypothetical protein
MRRKRLLLYAALALAVPLPAFALGLTGSSSPAPGSLDAQASLDTCGIFEQQIVCKLDVAFNQVAGADRYAATVTGPDGSVADYGDVGPGGTSLWVPYVGDGTYTVTVQAWGKPPSPDKQPKLLSADKAAATSGHVSARGGVPTRRLQGTAQALSPDQRGGGRFGTDQSTTPDSGQGTGGDTASPPPACVPPTPPDTSGDTGSGTTGPDAPGSPDASAPAGSAATLGGSDAAVLESQAQVPQAVTPPTCPDGSQPTDGNCCPAPTTP